jgi:hypothetical protein
MPVHSFPTRRSSDLINLGKGSKFYGIDSSKYYGADFDRTETIEHHNNQTHEYSISRTVLSADTLISIPKMKVHKKVGVTLNLKGLVGINTNKNYLIHYKIGSVKEGGDQYPETVPSYDRLIIKMQRFIYDHYLAKKNKYGENIYEFLHMIYKQIFSKYKKVAENTNKTDSGNWYGNDSCWRMTWDLLKIVLFADIHGVIKERPQRKIFCLVDGIIGGENDGPLGPDDKPSGCLVAGRNPIAVDLVTSRLMGFDYKKMKQFGLLNNPEVNCGLKSPEYINILRGDTSVEGKRFMNSQDKMLNYRPHPGWVGHIEI